MDSMLSASKAAITFCSILMDDAQSYLCIVEKQLGEVFLPRSCVIAKCREKICSGKCERTPA